MNKKKKGQLKLKPILLISGSVVPPVSQSALASPISSSITPNDSTSAVTSVESSINISQNGDSQKGNDLHVKYNYHGHGAKLKLKKTQPGQTLSLRKGWNRLSCTKRWLSSCALNSRWVLWSNTFYLFGNICYIVIDFMMLKLAAFNEEEYEVGDFKAHEAYTDLYPLKEYWFERDSMYNVFNFAAAGFFLLNPISDFMGSWAEAKAIEVLQNASVIDKVESPSSMVTNPAEIDTSINNSNQPEEEAEPPGCNYEKWVAIFFFIGSLFYLWLAFLDWLELDDRPYYQLIDNMAAFVFIVDATLAVIGWRVNRTDTAGTVNERHLLTINPYMLDWSGWGDCSFLLGSFLDAYISFLDSSPLKIQYSFSLTSDLFWTLNSILYSLGYFYGQNVRKRFANNYYTSLALMNTTQLLDDPSDDIENEGYKLHDVEKSLSMSIIP